MILINITINITILHVLVKHTSLCRPGSQHTKCILINVSMYNDYLQPHNALLFPNSPFKRIDNNPGSEEKNLIQKLLNIWFNACLERTFKQIIASGYFGK